MEPSYIDSDKSALSSDKPFYSYEQPSNDIVKCSLLKSPEKSSHASQFTKNLSSVTLKDNTIIHIQTWWDEILSDFCQYLSTNKICP